MKRLKNALTALLPGGLLFLLLLCPSGAIQGVRRGLSLFGSVVLPSLLPFFVVSSLLTQSGLLFFMRPLGSLLGRPFRLGAAAGSALPLCLLTGAPNCARLAAELHSQGALGPDEAARLLGAGAVTGPLFLIGTTGALLGAPSLGVHVYIVQLLCALINGLLWRFYGKEGCARANAAAPSVSPFPALPKALSDSCAAILSVGCAICVFSAFYQIVSDLGLLNALGRGLSFLLPSELIGPLAAGMLEIGMGVQAMCTAPLPLSLRLSLLCACSGFGGFSILCQSACFIKGIVPLRIYALQRLTHGILCFLLCRLSLLVFQPALPAWAAASAAPLPELSALSYSSLLLLGLAALLLRKLSFSISARR